MTRHEEVILLSHYHSDIGNGSGNGYGDGDGYGDGKGLSLIHISEPTRPY